MPSSSRTVCSPCLIARKSRGSAILVSPNCAALELEPIDPRADFHTKRAGRAVELAFGFDMPAFVRQCTHDFGELLG